MRGHEYIRGLVRDHLKTLVPIELEKIRTELDVAKPIDPKAILLADVLPDDPSKYPCILVQATTMDDATAANAGPVDTEYVLEYGMTLVCAGSMHVLDDVEGASVMRDRLMLATRQALMSHPKLADDAKALVPSTLTERTGQSVQDMQGRPMAIGVIQFTARVNELLADDIGVIATTEVTVNPTPSI